MNKAALYLCVSHGIRIALLLTLVCSKLMEPSTAVRCETNRISQSWNAQIGIMSAHPRACIDSTAPEQSMEDESSMTTYVLLFMSQ